MAALLGARNPLLAASQRYISSSKHPTKLGPSFEYNQIY